MRKEQTGKGSFLKTFIPLKTVSKKEITRKIILIICIIVFVVSASILISYFVKSLHTKNLNSRLQKMYSEPDSSSSVMPDNESSPDRVIAPKFQELFSKNSDLVGWLEIDNTNISFPVLQTTDNSFYLSHDFEKNSSITGAIFADYRYPVLAQNPADNTVIYGHNTTNGTFFGALHQYKKLDFMKSHPVIKFNTLYGDGKYKIVSCFLINTRESQDDRKLFDYHNRILFKDESDFKEFYDEIKERSYYDINVDAKYGDELLTLSTCSLEFLDGRFVIVARKIRDNESESVDTDSIVENKDRYMPLVWYDATKQKRPR